ncbi:MAG TPA: right-handed parallel beta-helix repeat-containing protein [Candidatus Hydrogenedentes bacterium]|nr:right-handed parallel beta-helix repeat-containing protein [Candidatus Hydrogenedentota bacterium]
MQACHRVLIFMTGVSCLLSALAAYGQNAVLKELQGFADGQRAATAALQQLIDESEGLVAIPAGTFLIDAPLKIDLPRQGYRSLCGANGATRLIMNCAGPAVQVLGDHQGTAHPDSVKEHTWEKERFPIISDLEILGAHEQADGIELIRTMKCIVRNVLIRRCRYGIHLIERNRNVIIADSHIYDCLDTGVFLEECNLHQINILGNHISYSKRAGIRQFNGDVHNVQITGNDIEYNAGSEESSGEIVLESPDSLISEYSITGNTLQARPENAGANILVLGALENSPYAARTIAISGNIIGDRDKNIVLCRVCRATISGNTLYGGKTLNLHFAQCRNIVLNGNNIGTRPSMHAATHDDGVLLEDCIDCVITSNILSEHRFGTQERGGALTLLNPQRCRVADCQIIHPRIRGVHVVGGMGCVISDTSIMAPSTEDFRAAVEVSGGGRAHLVQNNWICSVLAAPVVIEGTSGEARNNTVVSREEMESAPAPAISSQNELPASSPERK